MCDVPCPIVYIICLPRTTLFALCTGHFAPSTRPSTQVKRPSTFNHQRNKSLRVARFAGFAISTAFLDGPALGATPEGARTSPAAGAAPITA